jgi:hypothetical protein
VVCNPFGWAVNDWGLNCHDIIVWLRVMYSLISNVHHGPNNPTSRSARG